MSNYNVWLNEIRLRPSRRLLAALAIAHLGSLAIALAMPLAAWAKVGLALAILASMAHAIRHQALLRGHNAVVVLKPTHGNLEVETRNGVRFATIVQGSSFVTPWLTVLNLKSDEQQRAIHVVLLPDMLTIDEFRRLRVWLKWGTTGLHGKEGGAML